MQQATKTGLQDVWAAPHRTEAEARLSRLIETLRPQHKRLAIWLEETAPETLAFFELPEEHRKRLRTTNGMEHDHMQVGRRRRGIRIFPNEESLLRLTTASQSSATSSGARRSTWSSRCRRHN